MSPTARSFAMTKIDEEAMEALVKLNIDDLIKMMPAEETDVIRANLFKAKEFLTNTKKLNPQNKTLEEWLSSAMSGYETMSSTEKFTKFQGIHQVLQVLREVDLLKSSPKLAKHWNEILQKPYSFTPGRTDIDGNIITEAMAKARTGKFNINTSLYNEEYAKRFYGLSGSDEVSLFKGVGDIDPAKSYMGNNSGWKVGPGGLGTYFTTNPNIAKSFADSVGAWIGGTGGIFETRFKISDLPEILMNAGGTYSEWAQVISSELMKKILAAKNMRPFDWNAPRLAGGGYVNPSYSSNMSLPKFETGIKNVPYDMPAFLHQGERVLTKEENKNYSSNNPISATFNITGSNSNEIVDKVMVELNKLANKNNKGNKVII